MNAARLNERLTVYMQLMRMDKPIGTFLLLWPTLWALLIAGQGRPDPLIVLIFVVGTFLMRSAGCVINDYADRDFDGHVARTRLRPFARGAVGKKEALLLAAGLALLSLLLILPLNGLTLLLSVPALFIAASYPFTKRFFPLPQAYLGLAFSFGIPMAFAAQTGEVPALAWLLLLANASWTLAYDTAYAISDKPDDLKIGIKTSAITFGDYDVPAIMLFHAVFLALMAGIGRHLALSWPFYLSLLISAVLMARQYLDIRERDRAACFKAFLDNNRVGAAILAGVALSYWLP
ncbi:4-hydroxybenzoate polyprenyltransferase [Chromobacterium alkanivorans]|uniref:4-hydroxybenzoate octaprenyltransferase n=1 Tax=Chromobacterium TaxID=535 RepID=UPI000654A01C|nr:MULTISPECIES: 4-hydroxybenzoate octaprenyltransferase [Chromobacterium]KMN83572.1 4-hydroxybenzoate polyprenyltransferase [Chromobacterium sp. LK11]MBN3005160.1 4-hydroxybenzoate octaprenyltransferase [Chromobacterium alkanivorans]MCS3806186.1 4-hydroxybenzoate polyprenyltransferase [Chromobacterium alkanivorans]MCS3820412.1 4-hydroxybenzoate polyprenyltransferase [Chromobacterium alkanivorans]MCS3875170.1 4-hydroxybenzoate polyprenyltransferase [Chromobacterium alkanivorans]